MYRIYPFGFLLMALLTAGQVQAVGGDFCLTSDDGSDYSLTESRGKAVVLAFGFTFCPDVCPTALATVAAALNSLGNQADEVDALFVSLDPDRDTPEKLHHYTRYFHPRLRGLTGDAETLREVADQYRVRYSFVGKGTREYYTMDHSANLFVIDPNGKLLRIVPHGMPPKVLADSLRLALRQGRQEGLPTTDEPKCAGA